MASDLNRALKINVGFGLGSVWCFKMRPIYNAALVTLCLTLAMDISSLRTIAADSIRLLFT